MLTKPSKNDLNDFFRFEEVCTEFEANWSLDGVYRIQELAESVPELKEAIVKELVSLDCELLASCGQVVTTDRYKGLPDDWGPVIESGMHLWQETQRSAEEKFEFSADVELDGGYSIIGVVGRGGMGVVYEAIQQPDGRCVAIKTMANADVVSLNSRFKREAKAITRLQHPNIIELHGSGTHQGVPFFAMQLVRGGSLRESIREARALTESWTTASRSKDVPEHALLGLGARTYVAQIGIDVARALDYAHSKGVIHQDIKPSNILLDMDGAPLISDFGLARFTDEVSKESVTGFLGTPRYAAPEQIRGEYDIRSDVYSLGVTLYELLVLRPAYEEVGFEELLEAISQNQPTPLRSIDSSIPIELACVIEKAISKDVRDRYQTAGGLAHALEQFIRITGSKPP